MLRYLQIRDFALIEEARIEFQGGLTALTGETGAGKSLVLDALGLLAGMRASPSLVRTGAKRATVEAVFDLAPHSPAFAALTHLGLEPIEGEELIVRREIHSNGRTRTSINGSLVPLTQLETVASHLLEIGSQHEQFALLKREEQQELFDSFTGLGGLRERFSNALSRVSALRRELQQRQGNERDRAQRLDFLRFQVEELEAADLKPGELESLEMEARRLGHVEDLAKWGGSADLNLHGDGVESPGAADLLSRTIKILERMAQHDTTLETIHNTLTQAAASLTDAGFALSGYLEKLEMNPARLQEIEERSDTIRHLLRKHGSTEEAALGALEKMRGELDSLQGWESENSDLNTQLQEAGEEALRLARELTAARKKGVRKFLRPLEAILRDFSLPKVRLAIDFPAVTHGVELPEGVRCNSHGVEEMEILFSANEGEAPQPLRRIGSGGELSRVMLALRTLAGESSRIPLMVFDEVDAGISGQAARNVAQRLAALAQRVQIIAVTHNPTIAAHADHQLLVEKSMDGERTATHVYPLDGDQRRVELARLLDGGKLSAKSLALAGELLAQTA